MIGSTQRGVRAWLSAAMLMVSGCGAGVPYVMQAVEGRDVPLPSEGMAGIVFVMPGGRGDPVSFVDESGAFLGQVRAGSYLVAEVTPGSHRFYALRGASAYVVRAEMDAGSTYHALIEAGTLAGIRFVALRPADAVRWPQRDRWITESRRVVADPSADRAALDRVLGNIPQRILEADTELSRMSAALQAERTLARGDGIVVQTSGAETAGGSTRAPSESTTEPTTSTPASAEPAAETQPATETQPASETQPATETQPASEAQPATTAAPAPAAP